MGTQTRERSWFRPAPTDLPVGLIGEHQPATAPQPGGQRDTPSNDTRKPPQNGSFCAPHPSRIRHRPVAPSRSARFGIHAGRIVAYVRLRLRMQRYSVQRLARHTRAAGLGPRPGLSFGLIHPRTGPFTGDHPDRVRAARGRWRTPVNAMQHCWKACWGQPLASSNLASPPRCPAHLAGGSLGAARHSMLLSGWSIVLLRFIWFLGVRFA